jgi:hypothetical protein
MHEATYSLAMYWDETNMVKLLPHMLEMSPTYMWKYLYGFLRFWLLRGRPQVKLGT